MNTDNRDRKILVSACLYGECTRYDGKCKPINNDLFETWKKNGVLIPVCPEVLGGLFTPRPPSEIRGGRVINSEGRDVTENYIQGARLALELAQNNNVLFAIFKDNSPSCGSTHIYDGSFRNRKISGEGICAKLLSENGIIVLTENDMDKAELLFNEK